MAFICLAFLGMLQVSRVYSAGEVLHYSAACSARARTVGFNRWMVDKVCRVAAIPNAGRLLQPPVTSEDVLLREMVDKLEPGTVWDISMRSSPVSVQYYLERSRIPEYLSDLSAVAMAVIDRDGRLREVNRGFMDLMPDQMPTKTGVDVRDVFVNPRFDQFAGRRVPPGESRQVIYEGILNLGPRNGRAVSLYGSVYADEETLFVVAEHNVTVMGQLSSSLGLLNEELAEMKRELTRMSKQLTHQESLAEAALQDRNILLEALTMGREKDDA